MSPNLYHPWYTFSMTENSTPARTRPAVFLPLIPATGYWIGVANHACADPEYIHVPAYVAEVTTPDFCGGLDTDRFGDPLCPTCQAVSDAIPF